MSPVSGAAGLDAGESEERAVEVCDRLLDLVGDRAEALAGCSLGPSALTRFANSRIHQNVAEDRTRVSLQVVLDGGRSARAGTTRLADDDLRGLVERAVTAAGLRPADPEWPGMAPPAPAPDVGHWDDGSARAAPEDRARLVRDFVDAGAGLEAAGFCSTAAEIHALHSTSGQRLSSRRTRAQLDGIHRAATSGAPADGYGQMSSVRIDDLDGGRCGAVAAAKARASATAVDVEPGDFEVVLEPRAVAQAMLFPLWLGFNGKAHADGTSFARVGEQQFDAALQLWDDATDPRSLGRPYDAEGTPKRRFDLVRDGVVVGLVHDRRSAARAGVEPTGHAVGSDAFGGFASDVFLGTGDRSPEQMVADVERGLLVTDFWYNRILDPKTQVVTGLTRNGLFLIERGEIVGAVRNLRYTQSIVAAFGPGRILGLGDDATLVPDEDDHLMSVPTVHLASWSFTGGAQG
jgi:predicted Zn-dependent protease